MPGLDKSVTPGSLNLQTAMTAIVLLRCSLNKGFSPISNTKMKLKHKVRFSKKTARSSKLPHRQWNMHKEIHLLYFEVYENTVLFLCLRQAVHTVWQGKRQFEVLLNLVQLPVMRPKNSGSLPWSGSSSKQGRGYIPAPCLSCQGCSQGWRG